MGAKEAIDLFQKFEKEGDLQSLGEAVSIVEDLLGDKKTADSEKNQALNTFNCYMNEGIEKARKALDEEGLDTDSLYRHCDILNVFLELELPEEAEDDAKVKKLVNDLAMKVIKFQVEQVKAGKLTDFDYFLKEFLKRSHKDVSEE